MMLYASCVCMSHRCIRINDPAFTSVLFCSILFSYRQCVRRERWARSPTVAPQRRKLPWSRHDADADASPAPPAVSMDVEPSAAHPSKRRNREGEKQLPKDSAASSKQDAKRRKEVQEVDESGDSNVILEGEGEEGGEEEEPKEEDDVEEEPVHDEAESSESESKSNAAGGFEDELAAPKPVRTKAAARTAPSQQVSLAAKKSPVKVLHCEVCGDASNKTTWQLSEEVALPTFSVVYQFFSHDFNIFLSLLQFTHVAQVRSWAQLPQMLRIESVISIALLLC
jgi:hypothetical protein